MIIGEPETFECTNSKGVYPAPAIDVLATDQEGYDALARYIEELEKENRNLRRRCR